MYSLQEMLQLLRGNLFTSRVYCQIEEIRKRKKNHSYEITNRCSYMQSILFHC